MAQAYSKLKKILRVIGISFKLLRCQVAIAPQT